MYEHKFVQFERDVPNINMHNSTIAGQPTLLAG